jgi:hypothetical protein
MPVEPLLPCAPALPPFAAAPLAPVAPPVLAPAPLFAPAVLLPAVLVEPPELAPEVEAVPAAPESAAGSPTVQATEANANGAANTSARVDTRSGRFRSIKGATPAAQMGGQAGGARRYETALGEDGNAAIANECPARLVFVTPNATILRRRFLRFWQANSGANELSRTRKSVTVNR